MDLRTFPPRRAGEGLETYLRRALADPGVSISTLARYLDVTRAALYKIRDGRGGAALPTITRFGALVGELLPDQETVTLLRSLGLFEMAVLGWRARAKLLGKPEPEYEW